MLECYLYMPLLLSYQCGGGGGVLPYSDRWEQEEKRGKVWLREFLLQLGRIEMRYFNKKGVNENCILPNFYKKNIADDTTSWFLHENTGSPTFVTLSKYQRLNFSEWKLK